MSAQSYQNRRGNLSSELPTIPLTLTKLYTQPPHGPKHNLSTFIAFYYQLALSLSSPQVNFLFCQIGALFLASLFRSVLHPSKCSVTVRHSFALVVGMALGYFCFGSQAIHIAGLPALCFIIIRTQNPAIVQRIVMCVALLYLSCLHLNRQFFSVGMMDSVDITCPLMIITQKVISVAFQVHDGFRAADAKAVLTQSQRQHAIVKVPTALEFFSYTLHFQGLMAGPMVFYRDYIDFIDGSQYLKKSRSSNVEGVQMAKEILLEPSPIVPVVKKVIASFVCAGIFMWLAEVYPIRGVASTTVAHCALLFIVYCFA